MFPWLTEVWGEHNLGKQARCLVISVSWRYRTCFLRVQPMCLYKHGYIVQKIFNQLRLEYRFIAAVTIVMPLCCFQHYGALSYFTLMFEFTLGKCFQDIGLVEPKITG